MRPGSGTGGRVVLNFHGIGGPPPTVPAEEVAYWCPVQLWRALAATVAEAVHDGLPVEVTFDDGNVSDIEHGLPALLEHGITATFHVCAGRIGRPGYLDEGMIVQLQQQGMRVGGHGWDHVDLRPLPEPDLTRETRESQQRIAEVCGSPVTDFAVPLGSYDRRVLRHLRGYGTVYTSDATTAAPGAWLAPRWSYVRGWTVSSVSALAREPETVPHRLRQRLAMGVKRWR